MGARRCAPPIGAAGGTSHAARFRALAAHASAPALVLAGRRAPFRAAARRPGAGRRAALHRRLGRRPAAAQRGARRRRRHRRHGPAARHGRRRTASERRAALARGGRPLHRHAAARRRRVCRSRACRPKAWDAGCASAGATWTARPARRGPWPAPAASGSRPCRARPADRRLRLGDAAQCLSVPMLVRVSAYTCRCRDKDRRARPARP